MLKYPEGLKSLTDSNNYLYSATSTCKNPTSHLFTTTIPPTDTSKLNHHQLYILSPSSSASSKHPSSSTSSNGGFFETTQTTSATTAYLPTSSSASDFFLAEPSPFTTTYHHHPHSHHTHHHRVNKPITSYPITTFGGELNKGLKRPKKRYKKPLEFRKVLPKNSLMLLHELRPNVEYRFVSQSGPIHRPMFTMCVDINEHKFEGIGKTKKLARMEAAQKAVEFLLKNPEYIQKSTKLSEDNSSVKSACQDALLEEEESGESGDDEDGVSGVVGEESSANKKLK